MRRGGEEKIKEQKNKEIWNNHSWKEIQRNDYTKNQINEKNRHDIQMKSTNKTNKQTVNQTKHMNRWTGEENNLQKNKFPTYISIQRKK